MSSVALANAPVTPAKKASEADRKYSKRANSYRHIDKDPIIDLIRTEAQRQGGEALSSAFLDKLSYDSGISASTLHNWFKGDTKRPQHLTVKFVLAALGCRMQVVRADGTHVKAGH